jgi:hypothetical protein
MQDEHLREAFLAELQQVFEQPDVDVCKKEEQLLERLDRAILDVIDNPDAIKQTAAIGTLF